MSNLANQNEIRKSEQNIQNQSFDEKYNQLAVEVVAEKYIDGTNDELKRVSGRDVGNEFALATTIVDSISFPKGSTGDGSLTLTNANQAYALPPSAPTGKYVLIVQPYENNTDDIFFNFGGSVSSGILVSNGLVLTINLGAGQQIYFWSPSAGQMVNYTYKLVE